MSKCVLSHIICNSMSFISAATTFALSTVRLHGLESKQLSVRKQSEAKLSCRYYTLVKCGFRLLNHLSCKLPVKRKYTHKN